MDIQKEKSTTNENSDAAKDSSVTNSIVYSPVDHEIPTMDSLEETAAAESNSPNNPSIDESCADDQEIIKKIRGDAIGDTLYSEKFVFTTLMKLEKLQIDISEDEDFEKDLCMLWDMTIEGDVVKLLLEYKVPDIFAGIILESEDHRLCEILIGIIANMCNVSETRAVLCASTLIMGTLLGCISKSDSLTLLQLMRLLHAVLVFENSGDEMLWFHHFRNSEGFVEKFAFVLSSSMSNSLLLNSFEALNAICTKFAVIEIQPGNNDTCFTDIFVVPELVSGVIEAFKQMLPEQLEDEPTTKSQRIINLFLDINVILSQYDAISQHAYAQFHNELLVCITRTLQPLCNEIYLFPITSNEQGVIENINDILQALQDPFHSSIVNQFVAIYNLIAAKKSDNVEFGDSIQENSNDQINVEDIERTILEFLSRTILRGSSEELDRALNEYTQKDVSRIYHALNSYDDEDNKESCVKLAATVKRLWKVEIDNIGTNGFLQ